MKKADMIIIAAILVACAGLFLFFRFGDDTRPERLKANIYEAGLLSQTVSLEDDTPYELNIADGKITLFVESDGVSALRAECPSQTCVHTGRITAPGQFITCLPNRVLVELISDFRLDREVDVIAR